VIGRGEDFIKLSNGEWVSASRIEEIIEKCLDVESALVIGNSEKRCLVAVIVPSLGFTESESKIKLSCLMLEKIRTICTDFHLKPTVIIHFFFCSSNLEFLLLIRKSLKQCTLN